MAKNSVSRRNVEEEVRQKERQQIVVAAMRSPETSGLQFDGARTAPVEALRINGAKERNRLRDSCVELGKGRLGVCHERRVHHSEARRDTQGARL